MKTILNEIYEHLNTNDNTKEMYLIQWFEINKIKLLEAEKEQIETAFSFGYKQGYERDLTANGKKYYNTKFEKE